MHILVSVKKREVVMTMTDQLLTKVLVQSCTNLVSLAAIFWMSRNVGGALRDVQKTAARETSINRNRERCPPGRL